MKITKSKMKKNTLAHKSSPWRHDPEYGSHGSGSGTTGSIDGPGRGSNHTKTSTSIVDVDMCLRPTLSATDDVIGKTNMKEPVMYYVFGSYSRRIDLIFAGAGVVWLVFMIILVASLASR
jgi:hypothetical protein